MKNNKLLYYDVDNKIWRCIMKAHKYWSIGAIVTMVGTFYTGYKGLKAAHKYFGYFNHIFERESKDGTVIMLHKNINIKNSIYVHEVEIIVNRITRIFNSMGAEIKLFDKETDWEQIRSENWRRGVDFNDAEAYLAKFKDIPALFFLIEFKNPN